MKFLKLLTGFFLIIGIFSISGITFANDSPNLETLDSVYIAPDATVTAASVPLLKGGGRGGRLSGAGSLTWEQWLAVIIIVIIIIPIVILYQRTIAHWRRRNRLIFGVAVLLAMILPFYVYLTASESVSYAGASNVTMVTVLDSNGNRGMFFGTDVHIEGNVQNTGKSNAEFVKINGTGYDSEGNAVSNDETYAENGNMAPGSVSEFSLYLEDPEKRIVSYKLVVSYSQYNH